jgi:hypothetical protein
MAAGGTAFRNRIGRSEPNCSLICPKGRNQNTFKKGLCCRLCNMINSDPPVVFGFGFFGFCFGEQTRVQTLVGAQETQFEDLAAFLNQFMVENPFAIGIRVGVCASMLYHFVSSYPTTVMRIKICDMLKHPEGSQEHASAMVLLCRHLLFDEKEGALGRFLNFVGPKARHVFTFLFYFENSSTLYVFVLFCFVFCYLIYVPAALCGNHRHAN